MCATIMCPIGEPTQLLGLRVYREKMAHGR